VTAATVAAFSVRASLTGDFQLIIGAMTKPDWKLEG